MERLRRRRIKGAEKGRIIGAKKQQLDRLRRMRELMEKGRKEVGPMTKRDRFISGIALYLGDGLKSDKQVGFSNSNPRVIVFMMNWFREFCHVVATRYRGQIWIHDNLDEGNARRFWSKLTGIPIHQFNKSYIAKNKLNSKKIRKQKHKWGVFTVRVSSAEIQRRILGWMAGVLENDIVK